MRNQTYVSNKQQQHVDGRSEQRQLVDDIVRSTRPLKPARTKLVFNVCLQQWVELR
jgi:hypothetical protein